MKLISIIIPSYNAYKDIHRCLESIYKFLPKDLIEVIVVDNGSKNDLAKKIEAGFPITKVIKNKKNLGFGKANNQGAKAAQGKYLFFLNQDTYFFNHSFSAVCDFLTNEEVDILGPKLLYPDKKLQFTAGYFPKLGNLFAWAFFLDDLPLLQRFIRSYHLNDRRFYEKTNHPDWLMGAALIIKKELFEKVAGFDQDYFMYMEEVDLCFRAKKMGAEVVFFPQTQLVHLHGLNDPSWKKRALLSELIGFDYFIKKHYTNPLSKTVARLILKFAVLNRLIIFGILLKDEEKKAIYRQALKQLGQ